MNKLEEMTMTKQQPLKKSLLSAIAGVLLAGCAGVDENQIQREIGGKVQTIAMHVLAQRPRDGVSYEDYFIDRIHADRRYSANIKIDEETCWLVEMDVYAAVQNPSPFPCEHPKSCMTIYNGDSMRDFDINGTCDQFNIEQIMAWSVNREEAQEKYENAIERLFEFYELREE